MKNSLWVDIIISAVIYMNEIFREFVFAIGNTEFSFYFTDEILSRDKNYKSGLHSHNYCELIYVYKGKIEINDEENSFVFSSGEAAVIPKKILHTVSSIEDPYRIIAAFSIRRLARKAEDTYTQFEKIINGDSIEKISNEFFKNAFERMIKYFSGNFDYSDELIKSCLAELVIILKNVLSKYGKPDIPSLSQTDGYRSYVLDSLLSRYCVSADDISLDIISETLHLGKRQVEKIFLKTYGQTFRQKTAELKMVHAKDLICNTSLTVTDISAKVGYGSVNGFIKAFEKMYGITPEKYRKAHA